MRVRNQRQRNVTSPDLHAQAKGLDDCLVSVAIKVAGLLSMRTGGLEALESKWKKEKLRRPTRRMDCILESTDCMYANVLSLLARSYGNSTVPPFAA